MKGNKEYTKRIVLFDGTCGLCSRVVQFLLRRDKRVQFTFAPLQSKAGIALLELHGLDTRALSTFVFVEGDRCYTRSTAALRVCRLLPDAWPLLYVFIAIPRPLRDAVYNAVARRRYRWFGKHDACMLPAPEWRDRFLT